MQLGLQILLNCNESWVLFKVLARGTETEAIYSVTQQQLELGTNQFLTLAVLPEHNLQFKTKAFLKPQIKNSSLSLQISSTVGCSWIAVLVAEMIIWWKKIWTFIGHALYGNKLRISPRPFKKNVCLIFQENVLDKATIGEKVLNRTVSQLYLRMTILS